MAHTIHEGTRHAEVIQVIKTIVCVGKGIDGDPCREMIQYWTMEGELIGGNDPYIERMVNG